MRFRKNARLDPSQVEDYRGGSGGSGRPGGVPITLGGGGLIGVLVLVAFLLLSGGGGGVGDSARSRARPSARERRRPTSRPSAARAPMRTRGTTAASSRSSTASRRTGRRRCETTSRQGRGSSPTASRPAVALRPRPSGPFYCPRDRIHLHRSRVLRGSPVTARREGRPARRGVRSRARVRASRPEPDGRLPQREPRHRPAGRPGAAGAAGRLLRGALGGARARDRLRGGHHAARMWPTRSTPPRRWATTGSRGEPAARCDRSRGRTARPSSGRRGSSAASRAPAPGAATRSAAASEARAASTNYEEAAMSVNFAYRFRKLSLTESVGPLRCLARITSARPCESDSSPL